MKLDVPASPHFRQVPLDGIFNRNRAELLAALRPPVGDQAFGQLTIRGIPFAFGAPQGKNVVLLDDAPVLVGLPSVPATYVIFVHAVADVPTHYLAGLADSANDGNAIGDPVSDYTIRYSDGSAVVAPIRRRFGIQQARVGVGASAFAAAPARDDRVRRSVTEAIAVDGYSSHGYFDGLVRHESGRDAAMRLAFPAEMLWLYALPIPHPNRTPVAIEMTPRGQLSAVYAVTLTTVDEHPLRPQTRRKLLLQLPHGAQLDGIQELDGIAIDLGTVISARAASAYETGRWLGPEPLVKPARSKSMVVVEFAAHPAARLYVANGTSTPKAFELADRHPEIQLLPASNRPVRIRIVDADSGGPAPVRIHIHGNAGEYLPPRGHHRRVSTALFEDAFADFAVDDHEYAYVDGECIVDLPLGPVYLELDRGYETMPLRRELNIDASTNELSFEMTKSIRWREKGWVSADTHVHFLSPQTALLEGKAEGVNVVNLLATQLGEMYANVGDFDGRTTLGARDFGGDGEFLVRVGTENRMQVLGHISLLGYSGAMIHPLATGGPSESALGDALEVTMADWARQCLEQNGLVVMPHSPNPQLERAADIVLDLINAIELMVQNPLAGRWHETSEAFVDNYGIADWYRYLNLGYHLPIVGGSDKMSAAHLLGGMRTYAHLGDADLTYDSWMRAVVAGNTFATIGPLVELRVEGVMPGKRVHLPAAGGTVDIEWLVESVAVPITRVEVVVGGLVADDVDTGMTLRARGTATVHVTSSTWVAVRVRGSWQGRAGEVAAHTSAVQVLVEGSPLHSEADANAILDQIEGSLAYVDTLAPRTEPARMRALRATLREAHARLHARLHHASERLGRSLHDPERPHEH